MGFKWFKARMTMNRMPANSSAVAGSYRTMASFDTLDFTSNYNNPRVNGQMKAEGKSPNAARPLSLSVLNNPMAGIGDSNRSLDNLKSSGMNSSRGSSVATLDESKSDRQPVYGNSDIQNPVLFTKDTLTQDYSKTIGRETPKPALKMHKADYKKKKLKAPAPKTRSNTSGVDDFSENQSTEFFTVRNDRKTSQPSDIDV